MKRLVSLDVGEFTIELSLGLREISVNLNGTNQAFKLGHLSEKILTIALHHLVSSQLNACLCNNSMLY